MQYKALKKTMAVARLSLMSVRLWIGIFLLMNAGNALGQALENEWHFDVTMEKPATHTYHVTFGCPTAKAREMNIKMPVWTPGYYQIMHYSDHVGNVRAIDEDGKPLSWQKTGKNTWKVQTASARKLVFSYDVLATRDFVASPYLDETKGYILPAGTFVYVADHLKQPVTVTLHPYSSWPNLIATGLDSIPGRRHTFTAPDFDVLYDSPILMGQLEQLPSFSVRGIPHYFVGYQLGHFDRASFINDLKKIVESSVNVIGDIPYTHYTFLAIGPSRGGIEHLNSTSIGFSSEGLDNPEARMRMYSFLTHEYFHHYNVKRIRPIALGPFDYERENRTAMLWVSEGFTVYYEDLILRRAGLLLQEDVLYAWQSQISSFENKPGRLFQSVTKASYETWEDGPFGRTGDEAYKTISYYEKGPILGLLLDVSIRQYTKNKKSLDDVMRALYKDYYQRQHRGFTDQEFQLVCEKTAGQSLAEVFAYASTVKPIDYPKYLAYAGLTVAETMQQQPGGWLGITARPKGDSLIVTAVDWDSPAWKAGIRTGDQIMRVNGQIATAANLQSMSPNQASGETSTLGVEQKGHRVEKTIVLGSQTVRVIKISRLPNPTPLQKAILTDLLRESK